MHVDQAANNTASSRARAAVQGYWPLAQVTQHGCVTLWRLPAQVRGEEMLDLLDAQERARVAAFHFEADRSRCAVARIAARAALGGWLDLDPRVLTFGAGPAGKPCLTRVAAQPAPDFNVSHAGDHVLVAIAAHGQIGVDVERESATIDGLALARSFFAPREYEQLAGADAAMRVRRFFELWTLKEAVLKSLGLGITEALARFEMRWEGSAWSGPWWRDGDERAGAWQVSLLTAPPGYRAALAWCEPAGHSG